MSDVHTASESRPARPSPEWLSRSVIYQIYPRSFTPEGTLAAATQRLPAVADLGVDIVYLAPVFLQDDDERREFWSPRQKASGMDNPRNPYRIKDYFAIDPEYGTEEDLRAFVNTAHDLGLRVLLDIVFLHCGPCAVFLEDHPDFVQRDENGEIQLASWNFPKINFDNPDLCEYLWRNLEYWVKDFDVDGYRCDVAAAVPVFFWETARDRLEAIRPDIVMLSEGERVEDQIKAFDMAYSFSMYHAIRKIFDENQPASSIRELRESVRNEYPVGNRPMWYIDNHDVANDTRENRHDDAWSRAGVDAALTLIFTLDGIPLLYNGQEIGDTEPHSIYAGISVDWSRSDTPEAQARMNLCRRLVSLRRSEAALADGTLEWLETDQDDAVLAYVRRAGDETILVLINLRPEAAEVRVGIPDSLRAVAWSPLLARGAAEKAMEETSPGFHLDGFGCFLGKTM